jgi:hypothetical protein
MAVKADMVDSVHKIALDLRHAGVRVAVHGGPRQCDGAWLPTRRRHEARQRHGARPGHLVRWPGE